MGSKKKATSSQKVAAKQSTTVSASPDLMNSEIDPDIIHSKWGQKQKPKTQQKQQRTSTKSRTDSEKSEVKSQPKTKKVKSSPPFAFLTTSYPNPNVVVTDSNRVTRVSASGSNIVYFDRCLSDDTLSLRVESFSQPEAINMTFGVTTCNVKTISSLKFHVKSFCTNDGRPCGGKSLICKLDRKVRGAEIISFKKVPEGINFLSDGFLVCQFKDKDNIFRNKQAFPFIALTGDVESVRIADQDEVATGRQSVLGRRSRRESVQSDSLLLSRTNTPLVDQRDVLISHETYEQNQVHGDDEGFEEISRKKKKQVDPTERFSFYATPYMDSSLMEIREKGRLVVRKSYSPDMFYSVFMSRELSMDRRLALQVEKINNSESTPNCFTIGITTCNPEVVKRFDCHGYRTCWVKSECGGLSTSFNIHKAKTNSQSGTIVTLQRTATGVLVGAGDWFRTHLTDNMVLFQGKEVYPFILMNGSVCAIRIIEDPERFSAPLPRPLPQPALDGDDPSISVNTSPDVLTHHESSPVVPGDPHRRFVVPFYASANMLLKNNKQTVTRVDVKGPRIVMLDQPLEIGQTFTLRVEKSSIVHPNSPAFMVCLTTCNLSSTQKIREHGSEKCGEGSCNGQALTRSVTSFATSGALVLVRRDPVCIHVLVKGRSETREMFIDLGKVPNVRFFYPFLMLSGNAVSVSLVNEQLPCPMPIRSALADAGDVFVPPEPSPSFDRTVRRPEPRLVPPPGFSHSIPQTPESPPTSSDYSVSPFAPHDHHHRDFSGRRAGLNPKTNYPGVNGYSASGAHYDFENFRDRNTPTDWDDDSTDPDCDDLNSQPISSSHSISFSAPVRPEPVFPTFSRSKVDKHMTSAQSASSSSFPGLVKNRTASLFMPRKWFSNFNVRRHDNQISRVAFSEGPNYIFSSEMRIDERITFKISDISDDSKVGELIFGVTKVPILQIDLLSLPRDGHSLQKHPDHGIKWFTSPNLYYTVGVFEGLNLIRREGGIFLSLESQEEDETELIPDIGNSDTVYPFFVMNGCVHSLELGSSIRPLQFQDQVRLYLIFFYLSLLNRFAVRK